MRPRRPNRRPFPLLAWLGALAVATASAPPAAAAQNVPKPKPAAGPRSLDLRLPAGEIQLPPERERGRGYAARLREDPWSVLADDPAPAGGPAIPRVRDEERLEDADEVEELSLRGLLDGQTFPILTIRLSPEP